MGGVSVLLKVLGFLQSKVSNVVNTLLLQITLKKLFSLQTPVPYHSESLIW